MRFVVRPAAAVAFFASTVIGTLPAQQPGTTDSVRAILPAITVFATRDPQSWLTVPLAITRLSDRDLFGRSGYGLSDGLTQVPGVVAQSRYGGSDVRIAIRGFGARGAGDRSNSGTSRGVRLLIDGVPETEPDGRTAFDHVDLATITDIEVIRSNASALWGNAAGGVVSIATVDTANPRLSSLETQAGSFGLQRIILRTGGRLGDGAIAASFVNTEFDGWRGHSASSRWTANVSASTRVGPRTHLAATAVVTDNLFHVPGPLTQAQVDSAPEQPNATYNARDERRHNRLGRLSLALDHELGGSTSVAAMVFGGPKYLQRSERGTFRDFTRYHVGGNAVFRNRHRLGETTRGSLMAGVDEAYQDGAILFYNLSSTQERGDTLRDNKGEAANNLGGFVQERLDIGDRISLVLGARYDAVRYNYSSFINSSLDDSKSFTRVSPKLGVTWLLNPSHSLYANFGGGIEAPAGNETDPASTFGQDTVTALNPLLEAIRSNTFEVGTKHQVRLGSGLLRSMSYDLAVYALTVTNDIVPYRGGRFYFTAAETRRSGAELGLQLNGAAGLSLQSALTWSRNRYENYVVDSVHYGRPGATADYSGNKVVGVPDFLYNIGLRYARPVGLPLAVRVNYEGMSSYFADDANTVSVAGYGLLNATIGLDRPLALGRSVGLRGFVTVNNLLDESYVGSAFLNPDVVGGVPVAFEPGLPRNFVVSLALMRL